MRVRCTNIEWDISDDDLIDNFGSVVDDNGLPYTAKSLGLPAWDTEVVLDVDADVNDDDCLRDEVLDALSDEYGWTVLSLRMEVL